MKKFSKVIKTIELSANHKQKWQDDKTFTKPSDKDILDEVAKLSETLGDAVVMDYNVWWTSEEYVSDKDIELFNYHADQLINDIARIKIRTREFAERLNDNEEFNSKKRWWQPARTFSVCEYLDNSHNEKLLVDYKNQLK